MPDLSCPVRTPSKTAPTPPISLPTRFHKELEAQRPSMARRCHVYYSCYDVLSGYPFLTFERIHFSGLQSHRVLLTRQSDEENKGIAR